MRTLLQLFGRPAAPAVASEPSGRGAVEVPLGPARRVEGRREFRGLLWFPVLEVQDESRLVVSARAGLPHCPRCERALTLGAGAQQEEWECGSCHDRHPGTAADFFATDSVVAEGLKEFFAENPDFSPAPGLSAPARALAAAV